MVSLLIPDVFMCGLLNASQHSSGISYIAQSSVECGTKSGGVFRLGFSLTFSASLSFLPLLLAEPKEKESLSLSYQEKDWRAEPRQSFFWYDTDYWFVFYNNSYNKVTSLSTWVQMQPAADSVTGCFFYWGTSGLSTFDSFYFLYLYPDIDVSLHLIK